MKELKERRVLKVQLGLLDHLVNVEQQDLQAQVVQLALKVSKATEVLQENLVQQVQQDQLGNLEDLVNEVQMVNKECRVPLVRQVLLELKAPLVKLDQEAKRVQ
jgi:hypothetical protein